MTTYLATRETLIYGNPLTLPFCSVQCAFAPSVVIVGELREDNAYEFDETCATCGALIPASNGEAQ